MIETRLTKEIATEAIAEGYKLFIDMVKSGVIAKEHGFISVSVMDMHSNYSEEFATLYIGDQKLWPENDDYAAIARGKTRASTRTKKTMAKLLVRHRELLLPGDAKYHGNTIFGNIVVSCSSPEDGNVDKKITDRVAEMCAQLMDESIKAQLQDESTHFFV
jgi:hypothetical protein